MNKPLQPKRPTKPVDLHMPRRYPPKVEIAGVGKMTAIAGFKCSDGIVICSDSELTHADGTKTTVEKIRTYGNTKTPARAYVAWAGTEDCARAAFERLDTAWSGVLSGQYDLGDVMHEIVRDISETYVVKPEDAFTLICSEYIEGATKPLRLMKEPGIVPGVGHDLVSDGAGAVFIKYLADGLYHPSLSMHQAAILSVYAIKLAKKYAFGCGGDTKISMLYNNGGMDSMLAWDVKDLEQHFERFDAAFKSIFFQCADENLENWKFETQMKSLTGRLFELRANRRRDLQDKIDRFDSGEAC